MLGGELFVGVIISLYNDVEQISSPRVFAVLEPVFREFSPEVCACSGAEVDLGGVCRSETH